MKVNQISYYANTEQAERLIKQTFAVADDSWWSDRIICTNRIFPPHGRPYQCRAIAEVQRTFDLGIEIEILRYIEGSSWHNHLPNMIALRGSMIPFLSHVGILLDEKESFPDEEDMNELRWQLVQETTTHQHQNEEEAEKRRTYKYKIYESVPGTYLKYIKRHEPK